MLVFSLPAVTVCVCIDPECVVGVGRGGHLRGARDDCDDVSLRRVIHEPDEENGYVLYACYDPYVLSTTGSSFEVLRCQ
jgi:hypothetical protein